MNLEQIDYEINHNAQINRDYTYERIKSIADWIQQKVEIRPKIAIVCGSGLGGLGDRIQSPVAIPYSDIPCFPKSTVIGHKGNLIFGYIGDIEVVCMQGRFHAYEGYPLALCTMPMKMFKLIGVETVVLTCAAGSINQSFEIGDIMLIKDHVSPSLWTLQSPLIGHNDERFGPRFPASNRIYNKPFRDLFRKVAEDLNEPIREGVYSSTGGPAYETVTELRGLGMLGADCAGMSTAHEALVANYCGLKVLALALITNRVILEYDSEEFTTHEEVIEVGQKRALTVEKLVIEFVQRLKLD